jgi:hypothetical protein
VIARSRIDLWAASDEQRARLTLDERTAALMRVKQWSRLLPTPVATFREDVRAALAGDVDRGVDCVVTLNNAGRGHFALAMYLAGAPVAVHRAVLAAVWDHDHRHLLNAAAGNRAFLRRLFREAAFELPAGLPSVVSVYRGTSALDIDEARRGLSWTLHRSVACWFAMRFADRVGSPIMLTAEVPREQLIYYSAARAEAEVLLDADVQDARLDGEPEEWRATYIAHVARRADSALGGAT